MGNPKHNGGLPRWEAEQEEEEEEDDDQQQHGRPLQQQDQPHNQAGKIHAVEIEPNDSIATEEVQATPPFLSGETQKDAIGQYSPHKNDIKMKGYWSDPEITARDMTKKAPQTIAEDARERKEACGSQLMRRILCKPNRIKNEEQRAVDISMLDGRPLCLKTQPRLPQCSNVAKIESVPINPLTYKNLELEKGNFMKPTAQCRILGEENATPKTKGNAVLVTFTDGSQRWVKRSGRFLHWSDESLQLDTGDQYLDSAETDQNRRSIFCKHGEDILETEPESEIRPIKASLPIERHLLALKIDSKNPAIKKQIPTSGPEKESTERANAESSRLQRKRARREEAQRTKEKRFKDVRYITEGCRLGGSKRKPNGSDEDSTDNDSPLPSESTNVNMPSQGGVRSDH